MSKLKKLNRLNKSKTLNVALALGLVASNLVAVAPAAYAANPATAHIMATANKVVATTSTVVNKLDPQDVKATITTTSELKAIMYGKEEILFTLEGDEVTISGAVLSELSNGSKSLKFDFASGSDKTLRVTITDKEPKISSKSVSFSNRNNKGKDIKVSVYGYGLTLNQITNDGDALSPEAYEVGEPSSSGMIKVTILKDYLSTLDNGSYPLEFEFNGTDVTPGITLKVSNNVVIAAKVESVSAESNSGKDTITANFDKAITESDLGKLVLKQKVDANTPKTISADFTLADDGLSATAEVDSVVATTAEQTVIYSVSYNSATAVEANAITVAPVVVDAEKPVITLIGDATMNLKVGDTFTDPGSTVEDNVDKDLEAVVTGLDELDTNKAGTYTLKYNAEDKAGNKADEVTRTVIVAEALPVVTSVSVINATTVEAILDEVQTVAPTADKFNVTLGTDPVAVTNVQLKAGTTKTYTLTVNIDGKEGLISVNNIAASATSDFKKPELTGVEIIDSKQIRIKFSEKVNSATFPAATSFKLLNRSNNAVDTFTGLSTLAVEEGGTSAILTIGETAGFAGILVTLDGTNLELIDGNYRLYVNDVKDVAGNAMLANSLTDFTITPSQLADKTAPVMIPASYNTATGLLSVNFSEAVKTGADFDITKFSFTSDTDVVASLSALDTVAFASGNKQANIQLSAVNMTAVRTAINAGKVVRVSAAAGAYKDVSNNANTASSATIVIAAPPVLTAAEYNEETNILSVTFDKAVVPSTITAAKLAAASVNFEGGAAQSLAGATIISTTDPKVVRLYVAGLAEVNNDTTPAHTVSLPADFVFTSADTATRVGSAATTATNNQLTYTEVTGAPILTGAAFNNSTKKLELTFDKYIATGDASINEANIDIVKNAGVTTGTDTEALVYSIAVDANHAAVSANKVTIDLTLDQAGDATTTVAGLISAVNDGTALSVKLVASAVKGANGSLSVATTTAAVATAQPYVAIAATDATKPVVSNTTVVSSKIIKVTFSEKVNAVDAINLANYSVALTADANAVLSISNVQLDASGKIATLTLAQAQQVGAIYTLKIDGIKDNAGNVMDAYTINSLTGTNSTADPQMADATTHTIAVTDADGSQNLSNNDYIMLSFESPVVLTDGTASKVQVSSIIDPARLAAALVTNGTDADILEGAVLSTVAGDQTKLKLTLAKTVALKGWNAVTLGTTTVNIAATNNIVSAIDGSLAQPAVAAQTIVAPSATGPKVVSAVYADTNNSGSQDMGDKVVVTFDQNILVPDVPNVLNNDFGAALAGAAYQAVKTGDKEVTITFAASPTVVIGTTTVDVTGTLANVDIASSWSNKAVPHAGTPADPAIVITATDVTSPTLTAAAFNDADDNGVDAGDQIILTFSEAITVSPLVGTSDFAQTGITFGGTPVISKSAFDNKQLIITLAGAPSIDATNAKIDIRGFGTANISDAVGNKAMNLATPLSITNVSLKDVTPPTITSATLVVNGQSQNVAVAPGGLIGTITLVGTTEKLTAGTITVSEDSVLSLTGGTGYGVLTGFGLPTTQTLASGSNALNVIAYLGSLDNSGDGVSLDTLRAAIGSNTLSFTGTLTDKAGNVSAVSLTVSL